MKNILGKLETQERGETLTMLETRCRKDYSRCSKAFEMLTCTF